MASGGHRVSVLSGRGDGRFDVTWTDAGGESTVDLAIAVAQQLDLRKNLTVATWLHSDAFLANRLGEASVNGER